MSKNLFCTFGVVAVLAITAVFAGAANAESPAFGVAVGSSTLITTLDYSDTFTVVGDPREAWPPQITQPAVENNHGNPPLIWIGRPWSLSTGAMALDDTPYWSGNPNFNVGLYGTELPTYVGSSGAGSDTGITQSGCYDGTATYGIQYNNLRSDFIVQFDAHTSLDPSDKVSVSIGPGTVLNSPQASDGIMFDYTDPNAIMINFGETGIDFYNSVLGTVEAILPVPTGFSMATWHNYAVNFNLDDLEVEVFVDEVSCGVITTTMLGIDPTDLSGLTGYGISIGYTRSEYQPGHTVAPAGLQWTDNFQVGAAPVPEPSAVVLLLSVLASLAIIRRVRK